MRPLKLLAAAVSVFSIPCFGDCNSDFQGYDTVAGDDVNIYYRSVEAPIRVGRQFKLTVIVCQGGNAWSGELVMDAFMPAHGHGMNYKPEISKTGNGEFLANGLLLHMPGEWRLDFKLLGESINQTYSSPLTLR